jgi:hydrogenase expression/formation protein HypD
VRFLDEYRDADTGRAVLAEIARVAAPLPPMKIMEVCGGHTHALHRFGVLDLLPGNVEMVHGPGCPVCVVPMGRIDDAIELVSRPGITMCCYGDLLRVPGNRRDLLDARAAGADVRVVYSPLDALTIASREPGREVVFLGIGFETTAPATALTVLEAQRQGVTNFSVLCDHVLIVPGLRAILSSPDVRLDGFLGPGHVSTVIGCAPFRFVADEYRLPLVVSGFEPLDLLEGLLMVLRQIAEGRHEVENQYRRIVADDGNRAAMQTIASVFEVRDHFEWRGLGTLAHSALALRSDLAHFDAERRFDLPGVRIADPRACQCGEVLKGVLRPWECKVFGTACTPESPIGTCMVSSEGACAAAFTYGGKRREVAVRTS